MLIPVVYMGIQVVLQYPEFGNYFALSFALGNIYKKGLVRILPFLSAGTQ